MDDKIYLNIRFNKNVEILNEQTKIGLLGGQTPVQLALPNEVVKEKILLFVKDADIRNFKTVFEQMPKVSVYGLKEFH